MAIWSKVYYTETLKGQRLDSEYFDPTDLDIIGNLLDSCQAEPIGAGLCTVTSGYTPQYSENGIPIIRSGDLSELLITEDNLLKADPTENRIFYLKKHDVLISSIGCGSIGKVSIYLGEENTTGTVSEVTVLRNSTVNPFFLALFLMSDMGQRLIAREITGATGQQHLLPSKVKKILIPFPYEKHEWATKIYTEIVQRLSESKRFYLEAENIITYNLGVDSLTLEPNLFVTHTFKGTTASGRMDAEHFTSKSSTIEKLILDYSIRSNKEYLLGRLVTENKRGGQPLYCDDLNGLPVVNSKHVQAGQVILDRNRRCTSNSNNSLVLNFGDVLVNGTGVGTVGRCAAYLHDQPAIPDAHVTIIRTSQVDPIYLSVFLNSIAGQLQVQKHQRGSSGQVELYPEDIAKFYIWNAPKPIQDQVREMVIQSYTALEDTKRLLESAKKQVSNLFTEGGII
ncbi:EcoKI restriction-modification system protein HsdS [Sporomusa ovata DSM 2662]|uniref:DNA METHYLASE-TYPE I RESTRICTION-MODIFICATION SYSTEM n=1 Tax=Sporomusa ovata TaxID=2378 RepID=A0A0U1KTG4_9FIRM|nr:restriction endonuclease subunit S [Sporomusa ovata]EQB27624.1 hypothetical protein SOV_2c05210 [Sporomusa ovata DSM 2662]CQR69974.1 DNA METHYLASE-TYPE I RESTRICTION-MODIFICATION SYSTEM [Sporomusa ovata]